MAQSAVEYALSRQSAAPGAGALVKLPVGAVRPEGWLRQQLQLQGEGFHGHLMEISAFLKKEKNAWLSKTGTGQYGWEEVPYWLKGFMLCGYLLDNPRMNQETQIWIDGILNSRKPDGWFGPDKGRTGAATDLTGREDLWPNMIALFCLQSYYERTNDKRVLELMTGYFKYLHSVPEEKFLAGYWAPMAPAISSTASSGSTITPATPGCSSWPTKPIAVPPAGTETSSTGTTSTWLRVSVSRPPMPSSPKTPATWQPPSGTGPRCALLYGQVPGGMYGADENARQGYNGPRQAIETCGNRRGDALRRDPAGHHRRSGVGRTL